MDCSPPGSSAHGVFQARVLEWGAIVLVMINWRGKYLRTYPLKKVGKGELTQKRAKDDSCYWNI